MIKIDYSIKKIPGYILGFILFFAPFALFQNSILYLLGSDNYQATIHSLCLRIPIEHLISGKFFALSPIMIIGTSLLLVIAFIFGPLFCGFLCPAGAVTEYLSKLTPSKLKINWSKHLPIAPLRYGFLFGFLLAPFTGGLIACAYCNFYIFDLLLNYALWGYIVAFSSSMLLTMFLWFIVFGLFTQGGRGYCLFFCPVGATQNVVHYLGSKLPFTWKLNVDKDKCKKCNRCVQVCPMTALNIKEDIEYNRHICITCLQCVKACPFKSITYGKTVNEGER